MAGARKHAMAMLLSNSIVIALMVLTTNANAGGNTNPDHEPRSRLQRW